MTNLLQEISKLSLEEKVLLVEKVWDDIAQNPRIDQLPISPELEAELDRRRGLLEDGSTELHSWDDVKRYLLSDLS